jgi:hypothetical protein
MANNPKLLEVGKATQFSSTHQPKTQGRKPSHFKKLLKENNIGSEDARIIAKTLLAMNQKQLKEILKNTKQSIWTQTYAKKLIHDLIKNKIEAISQLETRAFGQPIQKIEQTNDMLITVTTMSQEERMARIDALLDKKKEAG